MTSKEHIEKAVEIMTEAASMLAKASTEFRKAGVEVATYNVDTVADGCSTEPIGTYDYITVKLWGGVTTLGEETGRAVEPVPHSDYGLYWLAMDEILTRFYENPPEPDINDVTLDF